jgi:hypothetical protein
VRADEPLPQLTVKMGSGATAVQIMWSLLDAPFRTALAPIADGRSSIAR